jgi:hypothetical protein
MLALVERQPFLRVHHGLGADRLLRVGGIKAKTPVLRAYGGCQQDGEREGGAPHSSTPTAAKNPTVIYECLQLGWMSRYRW